jgi:hypothetical protein
MNLRSNLFASALLLAPFFPHASLCAQNAGVDATVDPGSIVIERGDDRIVIRWHGDVPNITVNGSKVGAAAKAGGKLRPTVIDGYTVHAPTAAPKALRSMPLSAGSRVSDYALQWQRNVPLAYHFGPKPGADGEWGYPVKGAEAEPQTRPYIGVQVGSVPAPLVDHLGLDAKACVLILSVTEGGPAEQAGLRKNDILLGVDGGESVTDTSLRAAVGAKKVGDRMSLRILRRGKQRELGVEVGEKKAAAGRYWGTVVDPETLNGYWNTTLLPQRDLARARWGTTIGHLAVGADATPTASDGVAKELAAIKQQLAELKKLVADLKR